VLAIPFPPWLKPEIIPGLPLRWYGLMYLVAFSVAYLLVKAQVREKNLEVEKDDVLNLFFWAIIGLLVGARIFAVTIYDPSGYYLRHPLQIIVPFAVVGGKLRFTGLAGMSYHGGLIGTAVASVIYLRVKKFDVLDWTDMIVTGAALGYTFGRLGNFINGELYGRITSVSWGMIFPLAKKFPAGEPWVQQVAAKAGLETAGMSLVNLPRHPSQLYEAFFEGIVLWAVLWFLFRKRKAFKGLLLSVYIIGYGLVRFVIEYVREPDYDIGYPIQFVSLKNLDFEFSFLNFTTGQILCLIMIIFGAVSLLLFRRFHRRRLADQATVRPSLRRLRKKIR
jgi:phosphatidylglycerol:prolipoprotein diacylglycerol transferase